MARWESASSPRKPEKGQEEMTSSRNKGGSHWTSGRISSLKMWSSFGAGYPRGGGITIPGSAQEMTGCDTKCFNVVVWSQDGLELGGLFQP